MQRHLLQIVLGLIFTVVLAGGAARAETAVSEKAQKFFNRGTAAIEAAGGPEDFREAAAEFRKAYEAAPKWPDPYYNAGIALEKAGDAAGAAKAFRLYLKAAPDAADAKKVSQKADKLEYLAEKKERARTQDGGSDEDFKRLLQSVDGYIYDGERYECAIDQMRIEGGSATWGKHGFCDNQMAGWTQLSEKHKLTGYTSPFGLACCVPGDVSSQRPATITLSPDGKTLTRKLVCNGKEKVLDVFKLR
ncbi:MAG: hypothetical protein EPN97_16890 [Alphaproteobacteria bacterium]|nr:MAG: hypothetical protein EPN97_16890 [Alphaproteobacteria bacterium]